MEQKNIILKKEFNSILYSKKAVINLIFFVFYLLLLNIIANLPFSKPAFQIDMDILLKGLNLLGACSCMEMIYYSMIDEECYKTWDAFRLSGISKNNLIFIKTFIPSLFSFMVIICGGIINNIGATCVSDLIKIPTMDLRYLLLVPLCAMGSSLFCFGRCIGKKELPSNVDYLVFAFNSLYIITCWMGDKITIVTEISFAVIITVVAYIYVMIKLSRNSEDKSKKRKNKYHIKSEEKNRIFFAREIGRFWADKKTVLKLVTYYFCSVAVYFLPYNTLAKDIIIGIDYFLILITIILDVLLKSILEEKIEKTEDVLLVAGITKKKNYLYSALFALRLLAIVLIANISENVILILCHKAYITCWITTLDFVLTSGFSVSIAYIFSIRHFKEQKDIKSLRKCNIYISGVLYVLIYLIVYYFIGGIRL